MSSVSATSASNLVSSTSAATGTASGTSTIDASNAASQDRFLKLLVAQMSNQDPMNPMDNASMTNQMAQINTVNGISQLNTTMTRMLEQLGSLQMLQGASLTGHQVLVAGQSLSLQNGSYQGHFSLPAQADAVTVDVLTPGGQLLERLNLGGQTAGTHAFEWTGSAGSGTGTPMFKVNASAAGKPLGATALQQATVQSVSNQNGALQLSLKDGRTVAYSSVLGVL